MVLNQGRKIRKVSWKEVQKLIDELALTIAYDDRKEKEITSIYGIPRNGQLIAVLLSHKTNIPIATENTLNENTLIVDDINDSGNTLQDFVTFKSHLGIKNLQTSTLFYRKSSIFTPTYSVKDVKENWLRFPWEVE